MSVTPPWSAPFNGFPTNEGAINAPAGVNQYLSAHGMSVTYTQANPILSANPVAFAGFIPPGNYQYTSQPFTMPTGQTSIGYITCPIQPNGNGSDWVVSLCNDNGSGAPTVYNPIATTYIPSEWLTAISATDGIENGTELNAPNQNSLYTLGGINSYSYAGPAGSGQTIPFDASVATYGNFQIQCGGFNGAVQGGVFIFPYQGDGVIGTAVAQPSLPVAAFTGAVSANSSFIIFTGGVTATGSPTVTTNNVFVAGWDSTLGTISSWSTQASLPVSLFDHASASDDATQTVYVVGGLTSGDAILNSVYYAQMNNGQISTWLTGPNLPEALWHPVVVVLNGWLIVAGGYPTINSSPVNGSVWFSKINPDGSLNDWITGPSLPVPIAVGLPGVGYDTTDNQLIIVGGNSNTGGTNAIQILSVTEDQISNQWTTSQWWEEDEPQISAFPDGNGQWTIVSPYILDSIVYYVTMQPMPMIAVPLYATGLTPGSTYHVVFRQNQYLSDSDYGALLLAGEAYPTDAISSTNYGGTWSTWQTGFSIPITVFDATTTGAPFHLVESPLSANATQITAYSRATMLQTDVNSNLIAVLEATRPSPNPLNGNYDFSQAGPPVPDWTVVGGTLVQSNAITLGGTTVTGLFTPNGVTANPSITTNTVPITALNNGFHGNQNYYIMTTNVYANASGTTLVIGVNWYDSAMNFISTTTSSPTTPTAGTGISFWVWANAPMGAAFASGVISYVGTPTTSQYVYVNYSRLVIAPSNQASLPSVAQVTYSTTPATWLPTGVVQLS